MVRLGFIVEGSTEKIVIESHSFKSWAREQGIEICSPVIDAKGGGNLLPQNIEHMVKRLDLANPDLIIIMTDLENDATPEAVVERIGYRYADQIIVAVKALEAWFLADTQALRKWLGHHAVFEEKPEETIGMPWDRLKELASQLNKRGPGASKPGFAKKMVGHYGFSIPNASNHPNCQSVKKFYGLLTTLNAVFAK